MIHRIRDVRRARKMTLADVAARCDPPTTAQTIGRLETGMRTLSLDWLNRIAAALDVDSSELVRLPEQRNIPIAALIGPDGAQAPTRAQDMALPEPEGDLVGLLIEASIGDYRHNDRIIARRLAAEEAAQALNRDVLVPRPAGRFLFGRLIGREAGRLLILPLHAGARQQVVTDPPWLAVAVRLVREL